jgi:hypothetical protein
MSLEKIGAIQADNRMDSQSNGRYYTAQLRFTLQIRVGYVLSNFAQEEFSAYLQDHETLREFVTFADEFSDVSVGTDLPSLWTVSFSCRGELPIWIDDPVMYATSFMKNKFSYAATEVYMGLEPVSFVLADVSGLDYD